MKDFGIESFIHDGALQANNGAVTIFGSNLASTLKDGTVGISNHIDGALSAKEIAAHEMAHSMIDTLNPQALAFENAVMNNLDLGSDTANVYLKTIIDNSFGDEFDISKESHREKLLNELCGYISGHLYDEHYDIADMFHDYGAVKEAWQTMVDTARQNGEIKKAGKNSYAETLRQLQPNEQTSYTDAFRQMQPQKPPPATPYADLFRKFLEEYGGTREP